MAEFSHSTKRMLNRAATTSRCINATLNQEFVDTRRRLVEIDSALRGLKKSILTTRQSWNVVVRQQRDFTTRLSTSFPQAGDVQSHAAEVEIAMRDVQKQLILSDVEASPHQRITDVLDKYVDLLKEINGSYGGIELLATEKMRYERKVDALERRKYRRDPEKLARNLEKLAVVRNELDRTVEGTLVRMRAAFQKHEAVLQCAHHAFWMANDIYLTTVEQATRDVRVESVNVHQLLLDIQFDETKALAPVPRPNLITPGDAEKEQQEQQEQQEEDKAQEEEELEDRVEYDDDHHTHLLTSTVTSAPSFDSSTSAVTQPTNNNNSKTGVMEHDVDDDELNIPDVPTVKPITVKVKGRENSPPGTSLPIFRHPELYCHC